MQEVIQVKCEGKELIDIKDLADFQSNLKELSKENYTKLKTQILTLGFCEPFSIWRDKKNQAFILNGHQRWKVLKMMREEGILVPKLPANPVNAKDKKEAKRILLSLASQYGTVTGQGFYEFLNDAEIHIDEVKDLLEFKELNLASFEKEYYDIADEVLESHDSEIKEEDISESMKNQCPKCKYEW